jgi:hypothetical protein
MTRLRKDLAIGDLKVIDLIDQGPRGTDLYRAVGPYGDVALRLLEVGDDDELRARLYEELRQLAAIEHRGLRRIYEIGDHGDSLFVAMDLAPDTTLEELVRREGPLTEERVAVIVEQAAAAVAALHEGGIAHAELSPRNLFIGEGDEVSLAAPLDAVLADLGVVAGEPIEIEYVAPELAAGDRGSAAADVFGLGAVTYTALTGRPPVAARSAQMLRPSLSDSWGPLIARTMAADPAARPAAAELADEGLLVAPREEFAVAVGAAAAPPVERKEEPPRSSYARLDAPRVAYGKEPFHVTLGLASHPDPQVIGNKLVLPDSISGPYLLTIHLVASGFKLVKGDDWTVELQVTGGQPYPTGTLSLVAQVPEEDVQPLLLQALYSVGGQTIGEAVRPIALCRRDRRAEIPDLEIEPGFEVALPEGSQPTDLEVTILEDSANPNGGLLWTFKSKHVEVETPKREFTSNIGNEPRTFVSNLVAEMPAHEGQVDLFDHLNGVGLQIADHVPEVMWDLLAEVAEHSGGGPPSVLLLSQEPYVPWELATMERPLDPDRASFFGAQATVGRWIRGSGRRPRTPPLHSAAANSFAVVRGRYDGPGPRRLEEAEAEAKDLCRAYDAQPVDAETKPVNACLHGNPASDILHFAVHGQYDPTGSEDGIILVDGRMLGSSVVRGIPLKTPRFVFLNACQVGAGSKVLGDCSGLAEAFLYAGASAVVAPLWSIDDGRARELAKEFYEAAFGGVSPAAFLRDKRGSFTEASSPESSIPMAYQFFGHPDMLMERTDADPA